MHRRRMRSAMRMRVENYGRYEIIEKIATGGMAEIFLARSVTVARGADVFAIKRIRRSYSKQKQFVSRFIDEARICLDLQHDNIVRVHDFGQLDGAYFMAMEFVDGVDVAVMMRSLFDLERTIPFSIAAFIASEVAAGLHYAHEKPDSEGTPLHIVHRDVSPQNILLSIDGDVKVADFGIAAARNKVALTMPGTVLGKLAYMAPEQASGGVVDRRADLWGLGVLLHEMLTCRPLFYGEGGAAAIARAIHEAVAPPSALVPEIPQALDDVVIRLLQRESSDRFDTALDARTALLSIPEIADGAALKEFLGDLDVKRPTDVDGDATRNLAASARTRLRSAPGSTKSQIAANRDVVDAEAKEVLARFAEDGNLWRLVELGDRLARVLDANASASYCTAAFVFAARGFLVQAICALDGARPLVHPAERREQLLILAHLARGDADPLDTLIRSVGGERFLPLLKEIHPEVFEHHDATRVCTPFLGHLSPKNFAHLAGVARVSVVAAGAIVIQEGDPSDSLYAIGTGRFLASCTIDGEGPAGDDDKISNDAEDSVATPGRASLASFADGDFFGEFSFLTERPRTATVEAIAPGIVVEITHEMVDDVLAEEPGAVDPLLSFYKERVVEMTMAKSPIFGLLSVKTRKQLLRECELLQFEDEELVLEEGTESDDFYFVKSGEVEIFHYEGKTPVFIDKLGQGQFFGEASALTGHPRSASVRSMGDVSLLRFTRDAFDRLLKREPKLKDRLIAVVQSRRHDRERTLKEHREIFGSS